MCIYLPFPRVKKTMCGSDEFAETTFLNWTQVNFSITSMAFCKRCALASFPTLKTRTKSVVEKN